MNYVSNLLIIKTNCCLVGDEGMKRIKISPTISSFHDCTVLFKDLLCFKIGN